MIQCTLKFRALLAFIAVAAAVPGVAQFKDVPAQYHWKWVPANVK